MKRIMFDLETLSTSPNAAMIAVAVVIRDDTNPVHPQARSWFIDRDFVQGHIDPATLDWWMSQNPVVKERVFGGNQTPREVLIELNGFLQSHGVHDREGGDGYACYASPAMFDFPILKRQFQLLGIHPAWHWRAERCLSTIKKEIRDNFNIEIQDVEPEDNMKHHPVADCLAQFRELDDCLAFFRSMRA